MPPATPLARATLSPPGRATAPGPRPALSLRHHRAPVEALVPWPERGSMLSCDRSGLAVLWSAGDGEPCERAQLPEGGMPATVCVSPAGHVVCVVLHTSSAQVVSLLDGSALAEVPLDRVPPVRFAALSPDLSRLLLTSSDHLTLFDLSTGALLSSRHLGSYEPALQLVRAGPDATSFLVVYDHLERDMLPMTAREAIDGRTLETLGDWALAPFSLVPREGPLAETSLSLDGARLRLSSRALGRSASLRGHEAPITTVVLYPDSSSVFSADSDGLVCRFDLDMSMLDEPRQLDAPVGQLALSADVVAAAPGLQQGTREVRLFRGGAPLTSFETNGALRPAVGRAGWIETGARFVARSAEGVELGRDDRVSHRGAASADGRFAVALDDVYPVCLFDVASGASAVLPTELCHILLSRCPPIYLSDRRQVIVFAHGTPPALCSLEPLALLSVGPRLRGGLAWAAVDGDLLWLLGSSTGHLVALDTRTLVERARCPIPRPPSPFAQTAVLLPRRGEVVLFDQQHVQRVTIRTSGEPSSSPSLAPRPGASWVDEVIADDDERVAIVFFEKDPPVALRLDDLTFSTPDPADVARAAARRRPRESDAWAHLGLERAFVSPDGATVIGWRRGIHVTPVALDAKALRPPFQLTDVDGLNDVIDRLVVEDGPSLLLLRKRDHALVEVSLAEQVASRVLGVFDGARELRFAGPGRVAILAPAQKAWRSVSVVRCDGSVVASFAAFATSMGPLCFEGDLVVHLLADGSLRVGDLATGAVRDLAPPVRSPGALLAVSGGFAATLGPDDCAWLWSLADGVVGEHRASSRVGAIAVTESGELLVGDDLGRVTVARAAP